MKAAKPKLICHLTDWLPSYGENDVLISAQNGELRLEVVFDSKDRTHEERRTIVFTQVCSFRVSSFPGAEVGSVLYEGIEPTMLGNVIEFQASEAADKWRTHFSRTPRVICHFLVAFTTCNLVVEVFGAECKLLDAVPS